MNIFDKLDKKPEESKVTLENFLDQPEADKPIQPSLSGLGSDFLNVNHTLGSTSLDDEAERAKSRTADVKMTKAQYQKRLAELNENAENKTFVIFCGSQSCGKTYVISSLIHYMNNYLEGNVRLNEEKSTRNESLLYNKMKNIKELGRTNTTEYYELNIIYQPQSALKEAVETTFMDVSGEHFEYAYDAGTLQNAGELPDYLEVVLESNANVLLVFVYDQAYQSSEAMPQYEVLKAMYDKVLAIQEKYKRIYPKLLLLSKSDKIPEKTKQRYGHSAMKYALAKENGLLSFAKGFFSERNSANKSIFYSMGIFTKHDDLAEFDADCPQRLYNWIYQGAGGEGTVTPEKNCWQKFKEWLLGK